MKVLTTLVAALAVVAAPAFARDQVQVAGSSTVLPYASIVAEAFGENFDFPTPVVESGGSSAGLKRFCQGVGTETVDIANASRKIREKEVKACAENGVTDIVDPMWPEWCQPCRKMIPHHLEGLCFHGLYHLSGTVEHLVCYFPCSDFLTTPLE